MNHSDPKRPTVCLRWYDSQSGKTGEALLPLPITIGRAPENDIVLRPQAVSDKHARLETLNRQVVLRDLDSTNGILVDGGLIQGQKAVGLPVQFQVGPVLFQAKLMSIHVTVMWMDPVTGGSHQYDGPLPITLGRDVANTIVLNDNQIMPYHARLEARWDGEIVLVTDLVDDKPTSDAQLRYETTFALGPFTLTYQPEPDEETPTTSAPPVITADPGHGTGPLSEQTKTQFIEFLTTLLRQEKRTTTTYPDEILVQLHIDYDAAVLVCESIGKHAGIKLSNQEIQELQALGLDAPGTAEHNRQRQITIAQDIHFVRELFNLS